jgi:hypothetical protein
VLGQEAGVEPRLQRRPVDAGADEDNLLPPVAPRRHPVLRDIGAGLRMVGPAVLRHGGPPGAERLHGRQRAGEGELGHPVGARGDPEMALGADYTGHVAIQEREDLLRLEGLSRAIDIGRNTVFLGFGHVVGETVKLLGPHRVLVRLLESEEAGVEDRVGGHVGMVRLDDLRIRVQAADDLARRVHLMRLRVGDLVQDHHVGELDLVGQQMHQRARVLLAHRLAAIAQEIVAGIVAQQVHGVDDRDHRVEPCDVRQAFARLVAEIEGRSDGERFRNAGGFDQQVVEAPLAGEAAHLLQEIVAQGAADAAVRHLHQRLVGARQRAVGAHEIGVDVHLGHVVDDHRDAPALAVVQDTVQKRGLAGPEEAGENGDGKTGINIFHGRLIA